MNWNSLEIYYYSEQNDILKHVTMEALSDKGFHLNYMYAYSTR